MKILIKFTRLDSTPAITKYVENKIGSVAKFMKRWDEGNTIEAQVELARRTYHHKKGDVFKAEVNLHLPGKMIRAVHNDTDIRKSIDRVRDILKIEIGKYKELRTGDRGSRRSQRRS